MSQKKKPVRWIYLIPVMFFLVFSAYALYSFPHTSKNAEINGNTIFVPTGEPVVLSRYKTTIVLVPNGNLVSQSVWFLNVFHIKDVAVTDQFQSYDFQKYFKSDAINNGVKLKIRKVDGGIDIIIPESVKIW